MKKHDFNRVHFYSKEDMAASRELTKGETILRAELKDTYSDINDILELYHLKQYFDHDLYLKSWNQEDITVFRLKTVEYGNKIGQFFAGVNDATAPILYEQLHRGYKHSFWEVVSSHNVFKRISKTVFKTFLDNDSNLVYDILVHKPLVEHYSAELKRFLLNYSRAAEILLTCYEAEKRHRHRNYFIPKSLTLVDKEQIILNYLDSDICNLNYIGLIQNARNKAEFKISDRTKLKAQRLNKKETEKIFANNTSLKYGVTVSFPEQPNDIINAYMDDEYVMHYAYSLDFIKENVSPYILFLNFKYLFAYVDEQWRINLLSRKNDRDLFEEIIGIRSENDYRTGTAFSISELTSRAQIYGYNSIIRTFGISLENVLQTTFTVAFKEEYGFADNARFLIPPPENSCFEKVRLLAPEFESILKQFKLYVEDGSIDFELLQISSTPIVISEIPSLNPNKYIYFNSENKEMAYCSNLLFSSQSFLCYLEPFKEKKHKNFLMLIVKEKVMYNHFEEHQLPQLDFLIERNLIKVDQEGLLQIVSNERMLIFRDLYENEVASYHYYSAKFQDEVLKMAEEKIVFFHSSLFSKNEQSYFNYFLNRKEFTNGLELRNSYLHGSQADPEDISKHEFSYFTYLKLFVLVMLKINDDLQISIKLKNQQNNNY